jgi:endonuclease YncB( thermonuclease family)
MGKRLTLAIAMCVLGLALPAYGAVVDVLSGDVIQIEKSVIHIANIDAPSLNSPCPAVRHVAELAQAKLAELVSQGEMEIRPTGERDEDARAMAFVSINGEDVGEKMIAARLAQRHGKAVPLCEPHRVGGDVGMRQGQKPAQDMLPAGPYGQHQNVGRMH